MLSLPAVVDLSQLVLGHSLVGVQEIALTGGGPVATRTQRLKWTTREDAPEDVHGDADAGSASPPAAVDPIVDSGFASAGARDDGEDAFFSVPSVDGGDGDGLDTNVVTLRPMEIKTFRLQLVPSAL